MKQRFDFRRLLGRRHSSRLGVILESAVVGALSGLAVTAFRLLLREADGLRHRFFDWLPHAPAWAWIAAIAGLAGLGLLLGLAGAVRPMIRGSGIPQVKAALSGRMKFRWLGELPLKFAAGLAGLGAGLSLGREGPSIQIGSYVGEGWRKTARRPEIERKYLLVAGGAAGLSAAFNAPLAGVLFAMEELNRHFSPLLLGCAMAASVAGNAVAGPFFGLQPVFDFRSVDLLGIEHFPWVIVLGVLCALGGDLFKRALYAAQDLYRASRLPAIVRPVLPLLIALPLGFFLNDATGGGHELIRRLAESAPGLGPVLLLLGVKLIFTAACYGTGTVGGIFLPLLACGALLGSAFGQALASLGLVPASETVVFLILGMAGFFSAVAKAPVTGAVLILEMSGNLGHLGGLVLVCLSASVAANLMRSRPVYDVLLWRQLKEMEPPPDADVPIDRHDRQPPQSNLD